MGLWSKISGLGKRAVSSPIDGAKKIVGVEAARENFNWISRLAKGLSPSSVRAGRVETFDHAMQRQGVTESDLDQLYSNHVLRFWIGAIMLIAGWIVTLTYVFKGDYIALLPAVGFSALCIAIMQSGSFRAYQIANRRFCDVSDWLKNRSAWVPFSFNLPPRKISKNRGVVKSKLNNDN